MEEQSEKLKGAGPGKNLAKAVDAMLSMHISSDGDNSQREGGEEADGLSDSNDDSDDDDDNDDVGRAS